MNPGEQTILRTIAYFDIFNYPVTAWEVWKWQFGLPEQPVLSYEEVLQELTASQHLKDKLSQHNGFIFLKGRDENVQLRQKRYRLALTKFERAQKFATTLAHIPFVQAVFACNSLGLASARAESDIDFFIIVKRGHLWAARLLAAGWAKLRKLRPHPSNRQDKFCLSFFLADDSLDLSQLRLTEDPYLTMWMVTLVPLHDPDNLRDALWQANAWVHNAVPQASPRDLSAMRMVKTKQLTWLAPVVGASWFESISEKIQQKVLAPNLRAIANKDTRVVLDRHMLKFHDNDRRAEYAHIFQSKLKDLGVLL